MKKQKINLDKQQHSEQELIDYEEKYGFTENQWGRISCCQKLSENFMEKYQDKLEWVWVCRYQKLNESFIRKMSEKVYWHSICYYQVLTEKFILEFTDKVDWVVVFKKQEISEDFILKIKDELLNHEDKENILETIAGYRAKTVDFVLEMGLTDYKYMKIIDEKNSNLYYRVANNLVSYDREYELVMFQNKRYSEKRLRQYIDKFKLKCGDSLYNEGMWEDIAEHQCLSGDFIREFRHELNPHWEIISTKQDLDEDLIREFQNEVHWDYISGNQTLSENFVLEFIDKLWLPSVLETTDLSEDGLRKVIRFIEETIKNNPLETSLLSTSYMLPTLMHQKFSYLLAVEMNWLHKSYIDAIEHSNQHIDKEEKQKMIDTIRIVEKLNS